VLLQLLLGAFAKLRNATFSFIVSARPFVHMEQPGYQQKNFDKIWYLRFFRKSVENTQASLKSDKKQQVLYVKTFLHL
jgi:hypothetical protein